MRNLNIRLLAALLVFAATPFASFLLTAPATVAHAQTNAIGTYAITNARIVSVSNPVIERGTIVIRDGLIASVGADVRPPADARIIEGAGLTVYPGLIDSNTTLGIPSAAGGAARPGGAGGATTVNFVVGQSTGFSSPNSSQPPGLQPELAAADIIRPGGEAIDSARNAGITSALTAPREGIFIGQSAFINLAGDAPQNMIVRAPVALHIGFTPLRSGEYPTSLMGVFAALRQSLLDARRYKEANDLYQRNPRGLRRPDMDKSLVALLPVLAGEMPVVMNANTEREITRALDLAQEFNLRVMIAGGNEAYKVVERLKRTNTPVLLSLNFPRRVSAASPEADAEPLRVLRERVEAPKTAAKLAAAGVAFVFQSGAMTNINDYVTNAAKAIENGLPRDEALRAMTIKPAELFGVADRLGTIETGKIANLVVTRGDLFDSNRRIAYVFIDGRQIDLKPATPTAPGAATSAGVSGQWALQVKIGDSPEASATLNLRQEGEALSGSISGALGSSEIANASASPTGELRFTAPVTIERQTTTEATFTATVTGNQMRGTLAVVGGGTGTFIGTRSGSSPNTTPNEANANAPSGNAPTNALPANTPPTNTPPANATPANATPPAQTPPVAPQSAPATATVDLTGAWTLTIDAGGQTITATLNLQQQGSALTGNFQSQFGGGEIQNGSAGADGFRFTTVVTIGGQTIEVAFTGTATGNEMRGTAVTPQGNVAFTGTRPGGN